MQSWDVVIIGAGAAGLMCAITAGQRGRRVLVLDHANKVGKKILMSGGGRCNFTNLNTAPEHFISRNPHFCKSALSRYTPYDFLALVEKHRIAHVEKKAGQLFCKNKARDILNLLLEECAAAGVKIRAKTQVVSVAKKAGFLIQLDEETIVAPSLVIASGGLSIPKMGATGFGYQLANQFGLNVLATRAGLVPLTLSERHLKHFADLSGNATLIEARCNDVSFADDMLFTHRGLSGPSILQISSYWHQGDPLAINLLPDEDVLCWLEIMLRERPKALLKTVLAEKLTRRFADVLCSLWQADKPMNQMTPGERQDLAHKLQHWHVYPVGTEGYRTAEVTLGGVDTDELSSKTMESKRVPGLFFIGEVVDVTGQLGGFNFQWAWASGVAAGEVA